MNDQEQQLNVLAQAMIQLQQLSSAAEQGDQQAQAVMQEIQKRAQAMMQKAQGAQMAKNGSKIEMHQLGGSVPARLGGRDLFGKNGIWPVPLEKLLPIIDFYKMAGKAALGPITNKPLYDKAIKFAFPGQVDNGAQQQQKTQTQQPKSNWTPFAKCGSKLKKKGEKGFVLKKANLGCKCNKLKRVGGKLVNVGCDENLK